MSVHRKTDLARIDRSEVRFGWAVPLRYFTGNLKSKDRKRFVRHVFGSAKYRLTICNRTWYVENRSARQQHLSPTPRQLHKTGVTKDLIRDVYGFDSI